MKNKKFDLEVEFQFKGKVSIYAETRERAVQIAKDGFYMTSSNGLHTSDDTDDMNKEGVADWEFPIHGDKKLI